MAAYTKYRCEFYSENTRTGNEQRWRINIRTQSYYSVKNFKCTSEGFILSMGGGDDNMASTIKTTTCTFTLINENADTQLFIDDLLAAASSNENQLAVTIDLYESSSWKAYWRGVIVNDLVSVQDNELAQVKVTAIDGIGTLKNKDWDFSSLSANQSCLSIIKECLKNIPLVYDEYSNSDRYLAHTPFFYNWGMAQNSGSNYVTSSSWRNNVNRDPLALCYVNTEVFKDSDGRPWKYYDVLEQILGAFQLRIMMTYIDYSGDTGPSNGKEAMWLLQTPWAYKDTSGDMSLATLCMFHNRLVSDNVAETYKSNWEPKLVNPEQRSSGGLINYVPPLLYYKSIYEHKIMQNLVLGPVSYNSQTDSESQPSSTNWQSIMNSSMALYLKKGADAFPGVGYAGKNSTNRFVISGTVELYPYHWSAWEYFQEYSSFDGTQTTGNMTQTMFPRMALRMKTEAEGDGWTNDSWTWLMDLRVALMFGNVPWKGPNETDVGAGNYYLGWISEEWPDFYEMNDENGTPQNAYGVDTGMTDLQWRDHTYLTNPSYMTKNNYSFFTPLMHTVTWNMQHTYIGVLVEAWWNADFIGNALPSARTGVVPFTIISPLIPFLGNEEVNSSDDKEYGTAKITQLRLYMNLIRDMVTDDDGDYWRCCAADYDNNQELDHNARGVQWGYNYNDLRVSVISDDNSDNFFDYSIGYYVNNNGSPSEGMVQDPEIILGDMPGFNDEDDGDELVNLGVTPTYFGQFLILETGQSVFNESDDTNFWVSIHESSSYKMPLHTKRAFQQVTNHAKTKEKLDLNFIDRMSVFEITDLGFHSLVTWYGAGVTEQTQWIDNAYLITGGKFISGTGEWQFVMVDCLTYQEGNIDNESYQGNKSNLENAPN